MKHQTPFLPPNRALCAALFFWLVAGFMTRVGQADEAPAAPPETAPETAHRHAEPPENESNVDYFWRKSDEAFHAGDYERAIGLHKAIVALQPDDVESYGVAAWLMWSLGRGEEAMRWLEQGLKVNPRDPQMWDEAGQHYDLQKKFDVAKDAYAHAVEFSEDPKAVQMLRRRLAHAAEKSGDLALSRQTWRDLVRDFPDDPVNKNNLQRVEKLPLPAASPAA